MARSLIAAVAVAAVLVALTGHDASAMSADTFAAKVVAPHYLKSGEWEAARSLGCTFNQCVIAVRDVDDPDLGRVSCLAVVRVNPKQRRWRELDANCIQEPQPKPQRALH